MRLFSSLVSSTILYYAITKQKTKKEIERIARRNFFGSSKEIIFIVARKNFLLLGRKLWEICLCLWEKTFFIKVPQRSIYVYEKKFFYKSVPKISLCLWEIFFVKVPQRSPYVCEKKFFYKSVSKSSHWLYKFPTVPINIVHIYLFSFYFWWWVNN